MTQLETLQQAFQNYILGRPSAIIEHLATLSRGKPEQGLQAYQDAYLQKIQELLIRDYPVLQYLMGETIFSQWALAYAKAHPPHSPLAQYISDGLLPFLRQNPTGTLHNLYVQMAEFEYLWNDIYRINSIHTTTLTLNQLHCIHPEQWPSLTLQLHPTLRTLTTSYPIAQAWFAYAETGTIPLHLQQPAPQPITWILWSVQAQHHCTTLDERTLIWIQEMQKGHSLDTVCQQLSQVIPNDTISEWLAAALGQWVPQGIFCDLSMDTITTK